jgi:ArsR family transcriptional regulator
VDSSEQDRVFQRAAELFALLSTPVRLRIVHELMGGERTVSQLIESVGASQPNLSQHLATLYRSGLLGRRRDGVHMFYRIAGDRLAALTQWLEAQGAGQPAGASAKELS